MEAPVVQVFFNGRAVQSVPFEGEVLTIGRRKDNDIVLNNLSVSRHHATLRKLDRQIVLEDGGSENGCYVNGKRVKLAVLRSGDVIRIAKHQIVLRAAGDAAAVLDAEAPALKVLPAQRDLLDGAHTREIGADTRAMLLDAARADSLGGPAAAKAPAALPPALAAPGSAAPDGEGSIFDLSDADFVVETEGHVPEAPTPGPQNFATQVAVAPAVFPAESETSAPALPLYAGLIVQSGGKLERVVSWDQPVLRVGRAVDCDIVLPQAKVSRNHARFTRDGDRFEIQDLGSVNFTFVNGEKAVRRELQVGDVVQMGDFELTFVLERQPIGREMRGALKEGRAAEAQTAPPATVVAGLSGAPALAASMATTALPEAEVDVPEVLFGGDEEKDLATLEAQGADFPVPRDPSAVPPHARRAQLAAAAHAAAAAPVPAPLPAPELRMPSAPVQEAVPAIHTLEPMPPAPEIAPPRLAAFEAGDPELTVTQLAAPGAGNLFAAETPVGITEIADAALPSGELSPEPAFDLTPEIAAEFEEVAELTPAAEEVDAPTLLAGAEDLDAVLAEPPVLDVGGLETDIEEDTGLADGESPALDVDEDTFSDGRPTEIPLSEALDTGDTPSPEKLPADATAVMDLFGEAAALSGGPSAEDDGGLVVLSDAGSALSAAMSDDALLGDESAATPDSGGAGALVIETPAEALFGEAEAGFLDGRSFDADSDGVSDGRSFDTDWAGVGDGAEFGALGGPEAIAAAFDETVAEIESAPLATAAAAAPAAVAPSAASPAAARPTAGPAAFVRALPLEAPLVGSCDVAAATDWILPGVAALGAAPEFFEAIPVFPGAAGEEPGLAALPASGTVGGPGSVSVQPLLFDLPAAAPFGVAVATAVHEAAGPLAGPDVDTVRFELRLRVDQFPEALRRILLGSDGQGLRIPFEIRLRAGKD